MPAGVTLALATFCNLASPVITGILFEILTGGQLFSQYPKYLAVLGTLYIVEPLLTRVYINNACAAGEKASLAALLCVSCIIKSSLCATAVNVAFTCQETTLYVQALHVSLCNELVQAQSSPSVTQRCCIIISIYLSVLCSFVACTFHQAIMLQSSQC